MTEIEEQNLAAETRKFIAEHDKLFAEREKLFQEARKLEKERWWYVPATILGNTALAALVGALVAHLLK